MTITYNGTPDNLLTYTSPSPKLTLQSNGFYSYQAHNLFLNSASPADQSVTVVSGATYAVIITGATTTTLSGAATGTITAGTTNITAATTTLTFGSTSGAGTIQVTRTPAVLTYLATAGAARFALPYEWNTSGNPLGIRVESAATNLLTYSSQFDNAAWSKTSGGAGIAPVVTADDATAPDGTSTSEKVVFVAPASGDQSFLNSPAFSVTATNPATASFFVKAFDVGDVGKVLVVRHAASGGYSTVTLTANWQRFASTEISGGPGATLDIGLRPLVGGSSGTVSVLMWCAQVETGSVATSPIETFGSTVTRAADDISLATSAFPYNQPEGTLIVTAVQPAFINGARMAQLITDGSTGDNRVVDMYVTTGPVVATYNGTSTLTSPNTVTAGSTLKAAAAYKTADYALCLNGGTVVTDSSALVNVADSFQIGAFANNTSQFQGWIKSVTYLPRRLTNAELQALTA